MRSNMETPHSLWQHAQIFDWIRKKQKYFCRTKYFSRDEFNLLTFLCLYVLYVLLLTYKVSLCFSLMNWWKLKPDIRQVRYITIRYQCFGVFQHKSNSWYCLYFLVIQIKNVRILHRKKHHFNYILFWLFDVPYRL